MKLIQKFVLVFAFVFAFTASAFADYLDDIGGGSSATNTTKAAPVVPQGVSLHKCGQAYGNAALEVQPVPPQYQYLFTQFGFSSQLVQPMARHAVATSACFGVVTPSDASTARYVLKVTVQNLSTSNKASYSNMLARAYLGGLVSANNKLTLESVQVEMSVVDTKTGELVATAIGTGKNDDASAGAALLANAPGLLSGAPSQNPAGQVLAAALVNAFNQITPFMDNLVGAAAVSASSTPQDTTAVK